MKILLLITCNNFLNQIQEVNVIEILKSTEKGSVIVAKYIARNEDYITHEERIELVNIVCMRMVEVDPLKHFPSTETKNLYADAIVNSFPCLATKVTDDSGKLNLNHDVFYHPVAGGYIENRLKEIRRKIEIRKRKPNGLSKTMDSEKMPDKKKKTTKLTKGNVPLRKLPAAAEFDEDVMKSMVFFFLYIMLHVNMYIVNAFM